MSDVNEAAMTATEGETNAEAAEAAGAAIASTGTTETETPVTGSPTPGAEGAPVSETAAAAATEAKEVGNRVRHELSGKIFFPGKTPATEGTTYGIMQAVLAGHPDGLTAEQFTKATIEKSGELFKKSTAFNANKERHIRGYLVGGIKRGFFTTKADEAAAELNQKKRAAAGGDKEPKAPKEVKPRTSKNILEILETTKGQTGDDGRALVVKVAESMKKTLKNLAKGIASCVEQGMIVEHKSESGELVALSLTDKGRETLNPTPAATTETNAPAATTEAGAPATADGQAAAGEGNGEPGQPIDTPF